MGDRVTDAEMEKNLLLLALYRLISERADTATKPNVPAGSYRVIGSVDIDVILNKGDDYPALIVAKAEPWKLVAVLMSKLNHVTIDAVVREYLSGEIDTEEIKASVQEAIDKIKAPTETICQGKVTIQHNQWAAKDLWMELLPETAKKGKKK